MEKQDKIKTGRSLSAAIAAIMKESIKASLQQNSEEEKAKQKATQGSVLGEEDDDLFDDADSSGEQDEKKPEEKPPTPSKTVDAEKDKLRKGDIKPKDIVDKLNTIRAGKSFKDSAISSKMDEYIESLSKPEKVALLAFLKGLAQIVTGEVEAEAAQDPSDNPADVKMEKSNEPQKKTIKPNVIKAPAKEKTEKKSSSEDTSGPVPITPKKK
jgi:hypothetical protein